MNDTTTQAPKSAKTVTVACKLPNGVVLHVDEMVEEHERSRPGGESAVLQHDPDAGPVVGGRGPGVDAEDPGGA